MSFPATSPKLDENHQDNNSTSCNPLEKIITFLGDLVSVLENTNFCCKNVWLKYPTTFDSFSVKVVGLEGLVTNCGKRFNDKF